MYSDVYDFVQNLKESFLNTIYVHWNRDWELESVKDVLDSNERKALKNQQNSIFYDLSRVMLEDNKEEYLFRSDKRKHVYYGDKGLKIENMLKDSIEAISDAKGTARLKSFSKNMFVPLFKYNHNVQSFVIDKRKLNVITIKVTLHLFDNRIQEWDHYDWDGTFENNTKYYYEEEYIDIPIRQLLNYEYINKKIFDVVKLHIDSPITELDRIELDLDLVGFTMDMSNTGSRLFLDDYSYKIGSNWVKRMASYKKDQEVIYTYNYRPYIDVSYELDKDYGYKTKEMYCSVVEETGMVDFTDDPRLIQRIRLIYILTIFLKWTFEDDYFDFKLRTILEKYYINVYNTATVREKELLRKIADYLSESDNLQNEISVIKDIGIISDFDKDIKCQHRDKQEIYSIIENEKLFGQDAKSILQEIREG